MRHSDLPSSFMIKLLYGIGKLRTSLYWAHEFTKEMDAGARISGEFGGLNIGSSIIWENFEHNRERLHYEGDLQLLFKGIELSTQFSIIDDGIDDNEDLRAFGFMSYAAGFILPVVGKTIPYAGIDTFRGFEESIIISGLNFKPIPNAFIKAEYQSSSQRDIEEAVEFQIGFVF